MHLRNALGWVFSDAPEIYGPRCVFVNQTRLKDSQMPSVVGELGHRERCTGIRNIFWSLQKKLLQKITGAMRSSRFFLQNTYFTLARPLDVVISPSLTITGKAINQWASTFFTSSLTLQYLLELQPRGHRSFFSDRRMLSIVILYHHIREIAKVRHLVSVGCRAGVTLP